MSPKRSASETFASESSRVYVLIFLFKCLSKQKVSSEVGQHKRSINIADRHVVITRRNTRRRHKLDGRRTVGSVEGVPVPVPCRRGGRWRQLAVRVWFRGNAPHWTCLFPNRGLTRRRLTPWSPVTTPSGAKWLFFWFSSFPVSTAPVPVLIGSFFIIVIYHFFC